MCRFLSLARNRVELMINWCTEKSMFESIVPVFVMAYAFLLRLPSERENACLFVCSMFLYGNILFAINTYVS